MKVCCLGRDRKGRNAYIWEKLNPLRIACGSGIRNEEDYLITENGARLLGKKIPVRAEEVEAIRK